MKEEKRERERHNPDAEAGKFASSPEFYRELEDELFSLLDGESDWLANLANTAALIYQRVPDLNWAGFYLRREGGELILGPFQGKTACVRISVGDGVCGTAVAEEKAQLVPDVHDFPGHIACDPRSRSELVIPLRVSGDIIGVLDLDSPKLERFDEDDLKGMQNLMQILLDESCFTTYKF